MPETNKLPEWDLSELYSGVADPKIKKDLETYAAKTAAFEKKYKGKLAQAFKDGKIEQVIGEYEKLSEYAFKAAAYSQLSYSINCDNPLFVKLNGDVGDKLTEAGLSLVFFSLEMAEVPGIKAEDAGKNRAWLEMVLDNKKHRLSPELEKWIADSGSIDEYWNTVRDEIVGRMRFTVGDRKDISLEEASAILQTETRRSVRKEAYDRVNEAFQRELPLFTVLMNVTTKSTDISQRWRGYATQDEFRHLANRIDPDTVATMCKAVRSCYPDTSHRYYKLKRRMLGLARLEPWDRSAPIKGAPTRKIPWEEAVEKVVSCFSGLDAEMGDIARQFFDNGWVDAKPRNGKRGGGYCAAISARHHPYILINYQGTPNCVSTLAHEMGHGVHDVLAARDNTELTFHPPLTLAETASVFGEMLCFRLILDETENPKEKRALLADKVESMINTVVRQNAFYEFEQRIHEQRREGALTPESIGEIWADIMQESLGPACSVPDSFKAGWASIPHFMSTPFYVYAYTFGDGLVNSLWQVREKGDIDDFTGKFKTLLRAGGSEKFEKLLKPFKLDATEPKFWRTGMDMISGLIDEIEAIKD